MKLAAVVIAGAAFTLTACGGDSETGQQVGAYRSCERAVETQLKAPATAEFSGYSGSDISNSANLYSVAGYVDAQNSFGANVRTTFDCQVRSTGDNWELVNLSVG